MIVAYGEEKEAQPKFAVPRARSLRCADVEVEVLQLPSPFAKGAQDKSGSFTMTPLGGGILDAAMKIVLISTYELGRQPFGLASPAAWLRKRGHAVACFDLTRQELDAAVVRSAELIAIYLPMHTATRLACKLIPTLRAQNAGAHPECWGASLLLWVVCADECGIFAVTGGGDDSWRGV